MWLWTYPTRMALPGPSHRKLPEEAMLENSGHLLTASLWGRLSAFIHSLESHLEASPELSPLHLDTHALLQHWGHGGRDSVHLVISSWARQEIAGFLKTIICLSYCSIQNTQSRAGHSFHGGIKWIDKCIKCFLKTFCCANHGGIQPHKVEQNRHCPCKTQFLGLGLSYVTGYIFK